MTVREIQYTAQGGQSIVPMVDDAYEIVFVASRNMVSIFERGKMIRVFKAHHKLDISLALAVLTKQRLLLSSTEEETKIWNVSDPQNPTFVTTTVLAGGQWACTFRERIHTLPTTECVTVIGDSCANLIQKSGTVELYTSSTTLFISDRKEVTFYKEPCQKKTSCCRIMPRDETLISQIAATDSVLAICCGTLVSVFDISSPECPMLHEFEINFDRRITACGDIFAIYDSSFIELFDSRFEKRGLTLFVEVGEIVNLALAPQYLFVLGTERTAIVIVD